MTKFKSQIVQLSNVDIHVVSAGRGKPLLMLPATYSDLKHWQLMIAFFADKYKVYFFELPGQGLSTSFPGGYDSSKMRLMLKELVNSLDLDYFSIMAVSFGGRILLEILEDLHTQMSNVILLSPFVSSRQFDYLGMKKELLILIDDILLHDIARESLLRFLQNPMGQKMAQYLLESYKVIDETDHSLVEKLQNTDDDTLYTLVLQIKSVLDYEPVFPVEHYQTPCLVGMSVNDPMLDYDVTGDVLGRLFAHIQYENWSFNFHQPKEMLSLRQMRNQYGHLLDELG